MSDDGLDRREDGARQGDKPPERSGAEWTTLGISAVVVLALLGAALGEVFLRDDPPGVRISVGVSTAEAETREGQTYIPFEVRNDGAEAGKDVVVIFAISDSETVVEETTVTIPLLASHGTHQGELVTTLDVGTHRVDGRVGAVQGT